MPDQFRIVRCWAEDRENVFRFMGAARNALSVSFAKPLDLA